jgi:hypothetical protein
MSTEGAGPGPIERIMHELRTPLSVISGNVHIVYKHWDRLDEPKRDDLLRTTLENAESLSQTIRTLTAAESIRPARGRLAGVSSGDSVPGFAVEIVLEFGGKTRRGESFSAAGGREQERQALVRATLDALNGLVPFEVELDAVDVVTVGSRSLAIVTLDRGTDILMGSAMVRIGEDDAVARATLDGLNRFLLDPALT